jgi:hypothetical protein
MRFAAPSARPPAESTKTRACLTRYVPPPGFLTLLTVCSSTGLPALFHAGALMEFRPFRALPSPGAVTPLGAPCLPAVHRNSMEPAAGQARLRGTHSTIGHAARRRTSGRPVVPVHVLRRSLPRRLGFEALLPEASPLHRRRLVGRQRARCSPGLPPAKDPPPRLRAAMQASPLLPRVGRDAPGPGNPEAAGSIAPSSAPRRLDRVEAGRTSGKHDAVLPGNLPHR